MGEERTTEPAAPARRALGIAAITTAAILWAAGGNVARRVIDAGADVVELTQGRAFITAAALLLLHGSTRRASKGRRSGWSGGGLAVVFGLSIATANVTYYLAVSRLPVAVAIIIQYTAPALVVVYSSVVQRRFEGPAVLAALVLTIAGVALLAEAPVLLSGGLVLDGTGAAAAGASAVAFAVYMVTGERAQRRWGARGAVTRGFAVAASAWLVVAASRGGLPSLADPGVWPAVAFLGLGTTLAPFLLFVWGLGSVTPARAGIISTLEPLAAGVIAYLWLGQGLSVVQLAGAAMVLAGIVTIQIRVAPQDPGPVALGP